MAWAWPGFANCPPNGLRDVSAAGKHVDFSHACFAACGTRFVLPSILQMRRTRCRTGSPHGSDTVRRSGGLTTRHGNRAREYCEAHGLPLKAFGNWRAKFKAEPQPPVRKLLYRRGGLSHRLSHTPSHSLSHMTNDPLSRPAREGHRRAFSEDDKRQIVGKARSRARGCPRWPAVMG